MAENLQPEIEKEMKEIKKDIAQATSNQASEKKSFSFGGVNLFLFGWSVISGLILLGVGWNFLQSQVYESGLKTGAQTTAAQIYTDMINKAANDKCNTIFVQYDNRRVDLVNVRCLQTVGKNNATKPATDKKADKKDKKSG